MNMLRNTLFILFIGFTYLAGAQQTGLNALDYSLAKTYEIGGITVTGTSKDVNYVKLVAGLKVGDKIEIPGDRMPKAIKNLWEQKIFSDVQIEAPELRGNQIFLHIKVRELPGFAYRTYSGLSRSQQEDISDEYALSRGQQVHEGVVKRVEYEALQYLRDKGYWNAEVDVTVIPLDSVLSPNQETEMVRIHVDVDKKERVKIKEIDFSGNEAVSDARLRKVMKKTKRKRFWDVLHSSKYIRSQVEADLDNLVTEYELKGFRNASILKDSLYTINDKRVGLHVDLREDAKFHFRNIRITGNTKHTDKRLMDILGFEKGDVFNKSLLEERLYMSQTGLDVSSLYMNDGYLSFYPQLIESLVPGDSIDLEIRLNEGRQYRIRSVVILGNTKTHDHVIRREIRTRPGDLFNRQDVIRTQQELAALGYFDPAQLGVNPIQDPRTGMVDLEYTVAEQPSDRLELSGGWGAGRLVMTLGLSFTNFSLRNITNPEAWTPLPSGDGQTLNLRAQTNGAFFQSYNLSFIEPWLGGRKPNSLSTSFYYTNQTNGIINKEDPNQQRLGILGASIGLGKRLTIPDDRFIFRANIGYQRYQLNNWQRLFSFSDGVSHVLAPEITFQRNGLDYRQGGVFFPTGGSLVNFNVKATLPYSRWFFQDRDWTDPELSDADRFNLAEFHKWKFTTQWYTQLDNNAKLILALRGGLGFLGNYNKDVGNSPFERFYLGGAALTGFQLDGREIVGLRGYDDLSLAPNIGNFLISKYTTELRFMVSPNPSAQIYALTFLEAGNTWSDWDSFDPFGLYRSAGIGLRLNLPMFGPMGLDYGWRLDDVPNLPAMSRSQFHFTIGIDLGEL